MYSCIGMMYINIININFETMLLNLFHNFTRVSIKYPNIQQILHQQLIILCYYINIVYLY